MENSSYSDRLIRWIKATIVALRGLGGQGAPSEVIQAIARNENLTEAELNETKGRTKTKKFDNEVRFARMHLVNAGLIDGGVHGMWRLTEAGRSVEVTDELAREIIRQSSQKSGSRKNKQADYSWIDFYTKFADVLLGYKDNRPVLIEKIKAVFNEAGLNIPKLEEDGNIIDIDPFTIFALFNRGNTDATRIKILNAIANNFDIDATVPSGFDGVPLVNNLKTAFYYFKAGRGEYDIDNLWSLFASALRYANEPSVENRNDFCYSYDQVITQPGVRWNITMGLYWIRPYTFINLDARNREFLTGDKCDVPELLEIFENLDVNMPPSADSYLGLCGQTYDILNQNKSPYKSFPELSYGAWLATDGDKSASDSSSPDSGVSEVEYWIYSPGSNAYKWDEFFDEGIIAVNWPEVPDLNEFASKEEIVSFMKDTINPEYSFKNSALCLWQIANEMKVGDIVFVKKGKHKIIGKGIVTSEYFYDDSRDDFKHTRQVEWQAKGEWEHPGDNAVTKTLTNITRYTNYVQKLLSLFDDDETEMDSEQRVIKYPEYTKEDFLNEVYIDETAYDTLVGLLGTKYNLILQGAPGVGKTFAAKRLAYSIMGKKDVSRVTMVQFHQSYSYEDFIQGYRPSENGFELVDGAFYKFCKTAEDDEENLYFFIIDEINRGNLSKILGELMMLIEKDKRGDKIELLYSNDKFTVPKNVRIIGMMNTADRSLALIDYALRRRFAFYSFKPAFASDGFKTYLDERNSQKLNSLVETVMQLNEAIANDESLGSDFQIGHSYFICNDDNTTDDWLRSIIEYELVPLLKEYWYDEPSKIATWAESLRKSIR